MIGRRTERRQGEVPAGIDGRPEAGKTDRPKANMVALYLIALVMLVVAAFIVGRQRGTAFREAGHTVHSLPTYHGLFTASATLIPMLLVLALWGPIAPRVVEHFAVGSLPSNLQPTDDLTWAATIRNIVLAADGQATEATDASMPSRRFDLHLLALS